MRLDIPAKVSHRVAPARSMWIAVLLFCASTCAWAPPAFAEPASPQSETTSPIDVEANPQVFATMCALVAAGFENDSTALDPDFARLKAHLRSLHGPAAEALRNYYSRHTFGDSGTTLSRFITFALVASPAPSFEPVLKGDALPPGAAALDGFAEVLANFYREAQIEQLWREFQPAYDRAASNVREPLSQTVLASTAYLREILQPGVRTFRIYVEPMVGKETNVRNIGDQYIVVTSSASSSVDLMRHAFLHYLLDPLPIRYRDQLAGEQPLLTIADRAPNLPYEYRTDLTSFFDECLVRAVELRVRRLPPAQLAEEVNSAEANGYVLIRPLLKALAKFESSEPSMSLYFLDLVKSLDVATEQQRLQTVKFAPAADSFPARETAEGLGAKRADAEDASLDLESQLIAAERLIAERDASGAAEAFERILLKTPGQPRAVYGLAVASILEGDAERAVTLFDQVLAAARADSPQMRPEASTLAWSHIYLGRLHDLQEDREEALQEYRAALAVQNAPETARSAAQHGIDQAYKPAVNRPSPE